MGKKQRSKKERERRVAVVPVIVGKHKRKLKIGLVTPRCSGGWIVPTGKTEKKMSNRQVATLEAFEEAGMLGKLDREFRIDVLLPSPCKQYERRTTVFLLYVKRILKSWPEDDERRRKKVSLKAYLRMVPNQKLKRRLSKAGKHGAINGK
jgi:8-oxo-dGTP pyrophosphatase MutT (NUDIX family)